MFSTRDTTHDTNDELRFLDQIGTYKQKSAQSNLDKLPAAVRHAVIKRMSAVRPRIRAPWLGEPYTARDESPPVTYADWLRAYIRASALRQEWGDIDRIAAVGYAKALLAQKETP